MAKTKPRKSKLAAVTLVNMYFWAFAYATLIPVLIAAGISKNGSVFDATAQSMLPVNHTADFLKYFAISIVLYYGRVALLLYPLLLSNTKWRAVSRYGALATVLPEFLIVYTAISLLTRSPDSCETSGMLLSCGWGFLIILPIILSTIAQMLGMLLGFTIAWFTKPAHAKHRTVKY